jgi:uncharacterized protein with gpF-like domain
VQRHDALGAQEQAYFSRPEVARMILGYIYNNPNDARSRPSHASLVGEFIAADSPELDALGMPPFSFMCRCFLSPVTRRPGRDAPTMSPGVMSKIRALERF